MNIDISTIQREYSQKRTNALKENALYVQSIYDKSPELLDIENEIKRLGLEATKTALQKEKDSNNEKVKEILDKIKQLKKNKDDYLNKNGISLKPKYECEKCKDTGYITIDAHTQMCTCMKQKLLDQYYNKFNQHKLKLENFENFDDSLFSDKKNPEKYKSNDSPREHINKIKALAIDFIDNFEEDNSKNLLFTGDPGTGKTFISGCIANELIKKGHTVLYQTSPLLLDAIFDYKFGSKSKTSKDLYDSLFNVDLLIIDDLGTENLSAAKFTELFSIINSRMLNPNTKTIISSNYDLEKLAKLYDERVISRLIGQYTGCRFFGDDIRLLKKNK